MVVALFPLLPGYGCGDDNALTIADEGNVVGSPLLC